MDSDKGFSYIPNLQSLKTIKINKRDSYKMVSLSFMQSSATLQLIYDVQETNFTKGETWC